jgi:V8-like Glu-specific endopeptidase
VIVLPRSFAGLARFMPVQALSRKALEQLAAGGLVTIAGYPGDRPLGTMWWHSERLKKVTPTRLLYSIDTCPGHSGSPIWTRQRGRRVIIGVHTSGILDNEGRSYGCAPGTLLAPAGLMNSGVRITPQVLAALRDPARPRPGPRAMRRLP